ncbi:MAG TPA: addiction module toxin RelE [Gammaproteobacteria bacterium]|nr:addiction module toxin RelE [Gammaproteobacteria bacterium]
MARPTRMEFPGASYLVSTAAVTGRPAFGTEADRAEFLDVLAQISRRLGWQTHAYALLEDHYLLFLQTPQADLSRGMRQLNGVYTQHFNQRTGTDGSLFQGRFKALLVDTETWYREVLRHVLNEPRRRARIRRVERYSGSSLGHLLAPESAPEWLPAAEVLTHFGRTRAKSVAALQAWLAEPDTFDPRQHVRRQIFLGDEAFIDEAQRLASRRARGNSGKRSDLKGFLRGQADKKAAMARAYLSGHFRMQEIADFFDVHYSTVSRAVKAWEATQGN